MVPAAILTDGRVASCPPLSRLLYHEMYLRAVLGPGRDRIPLQPGLPYATQVRFLVGDDTERLDKLIAAGAVVLERDCLRIALTVTALNAEARQRTAEGAEVEGMGLAASDDSEGPDDAPAPRQKPSSTKTAMRYRHDAAAFAKRAKGWSRIPPALTWPQWLATDDGTTWTTTRERAYPGYTQWVTRVILGGDTKGVTRGDARVTPSGDTPSETYVSSENSEEEKKERRDCKAGDTPGVTPPKKASPPAGDTLLDALRDAAGDRATLPLTGSAIERGAAKVLTAAHVTFDEIRRMGEALGEPARWWPPGKDPAPRHCTWKPLAGYRADGGGYEYGPLLALLAHVRAAQAPKPSGRAPAARDLSLSPAELIHRMLKGEMS
jgi:hypothetical protein